ncbi:MAG TPA: DUF2520 domain-containing protein [Acidimicrobiales bacterium]|nr:DUF2520 domain-containing protein [Acidimicrobiales bacterium]
MPTVRFVGPGRAGRSLSAALAAAGWRVVGFVGRHDDVSTAADGVDVLVLATPDDAVAAVAAAVRPRPDTVVLHLSGSLGLDVLAPHRRRAALHPLVPLPNPHDGARRLAAGATFAVAGDPVARRMAEALGGRVVEVADADRAAYHAAAAIAANHVVALLGQVERVAATAGLPLDAFLDLTRAAVDDVARLGPRRALTGPAARGDWATLARHLDALPPEERAGYNAGVGLALQLAIDGPTPADLAAAPAAADRVAAPVPVPADLVAAPVPADPTAFPAAAPAVAGPADVDDVPEVRMPPVPAGVG